MNCENCGKNYANVRYTQIINGNKREMFLCEDCSKVLGIEKLSLSMDFSGFLGELFAGFNQESIFPELLNTNELKCKRCNSTFEDFINSGRFGCEDCYTTFESKIDSILRNIQGANRHIGRIENVDRGNGRVKKINREIEKNEELEVAAQNPELEKLKHELKIAVRDERYEEAAILRDKIKKLEGEN